jgi:hypothetical protein
MMAPWRAETCSQEYNLIRTSIEYKLVVFIDGLHNQWLFCKVLLPLFFNENLSFKTLKAVVLLTYCRRICLLALCVVCITVTLTIVTQRTLCEFMYLVVYKESNLRVRAGCLPSAVIAASVSGGLLRGSCRNQSALKLRILCYTQLLNTFVTSKTLILPFEYQVIFLLRSVTQRARKEYAGVELHFLVFLTPLLYGGNYSDSRPGLITSKERIPWYPSAGSLGGWWPCLEALEKKEISCPLRQANHDSSVILRFLEPLP